jgi:hypothetical protein
VATDKSSIFWAVTPCDSVRVKRCFGGTYRLHLLGPRVRKARNQQNSPPVSADFFGLGFLLDTGD